MISITNTVAMVILFAATLLIYYLKALLYWHWHINHFINTRSRTVEVEVETRIFNIFGEEKKSQTRMTAIFWKDFLSP